MKVNKIVMAIFAATILLLLAAAFLLYQGISQFRDVSGQLNASSHTLADLYSRNPFPSEQNIVLEQERLEILRQELADVMADLAEGQVEPVQTAPLRFIEMFRDTSQRLTETAARRSIILPENIAFGFQRHLAGDLPNPADVPRLIQQLEIVAQLVNTLYDSGISELVKVTRQEFEIRASRETPAGRPPAGGGLFGAPARQPTATDTRDAEPLSRVGILAEDANYASLRFTLEFTSRENALQEVMNRLARHPMFIVVTHVEINSAFEWKPERTGTTAAQTDDNVPAASHALDPSAPPPRSARVITDGMQKPMRVRLDLQVYRFRKDNES